MEWCPMFACHKAQIEASQPVNLIRRKWEIGRKYNLTQGSQQELSNREGGSRGGGGGGGGSGSGSGSGSGLGCRGQWFAD